MKTNIYLAMLFIISALFLSCAKLYDVNKENIVVKEQDIYSSLSADTSANVLFMYNATLNPNAKIRGFQGITSVGYNAGIYYIAMMCGVKGEEPGGYISVASSNDEGATWKLNRLIIAPSKDSLRHFDPSFWNDKSGDLHMSWTLSDGMWDGAKGGVWHVKMKERDDKLVITKPKRLFSGVMNVKPLQMDSTVLFPVSGWNFWDAVYGGHQYIRTPDEINGPVVYKSTFDKSETGFTPPAKLYMIPTVLPRTFDEFMLVNFGKDSLIAMLRTNLNMGISKSFDGGKTWGRQEEFKGVGQTTSSRFYFGKLKSGNLLLILNNSTGRKNMTAYLSKDKGKTWPYKLVIDERDNSYPDVVLNSNNEICVVYDRRRGDTGEIYFCKISENDIVGGDSKSINLITVTKLK
ncbi:sialidase family protein [Runella sp.]|uniref:sialidase family protein n=1 Tax=Runella sp. TaxID=1960881 RepID=UPI003D0AA0BC